LILERAFSGELVPQDPSDEPASVLLDSIRAAKDVFVATTGRRRKAVRP
jgi:type I restriction enzyme S subunit